MAWLNTPGNRPLTLAELRGKVVLIDFWTYSCINRQRALPHVEAWYKDYEKYWVCGGRVHTPEFAFEHVLSNVRAAARNLGVDLSRSAVDSNYATWDAWANQAWPADYLIDAKGNVRATSVGEGGYALQRRRHKGTADGQWRVAPPPTDRRRQRDPDVDHNARKLPRL